MIRIDAAWLAVSKALRESLDRPHERVTIAQWAKQLIRLCRELDHSVGA